jgi:probable HAF family extracellular repeat protein
MKTILNSIAAGSLLATLALAQQPRYTLTDLGTLPGGTFSQATYLNENRLVTGLSTVADGTQHAALWFGPLRIDIGAPGLNSGVFGFNELGQGSIQTEVSAKDPNNENFCAYGTGRRCLAALWQRGTMIALPTLGGNNSTVGNINASGEIAGVAETAVRDPQCPSTVAIGGTGPQALDFEAVVWGPGPGQMRELRPLPGDTVGMALWINDNGQAVGSSGTCANSGLPPLAYGAHSVLWEKDGSAHDLGNLGAALLNMALAINNRGQVVGASSLTDSSTPASGTHAFLWGSTTGMHDLGTLPGDVASGGVGINDAGDVVGVSFDAEGNPRGVLWHDGVMSDLNTLIPHASPLNLLFASVINSRGEIAGFGVTDGGDVHAFLATPGNGTNDSDTFSTAEVPRSPVVISEDLRRAFQRGFPVGRFAAGLLKPR